MLYDANILQACALKDPQSDTLQAHFKLFYRCIWLFYPIATVAKSCFLFVERLTLAMSPLAYVVKR